MKLIIDTENGSFYIKLDENREVVESEEVRPGLVLDFDANNQVVGIELVKLNEQFSFDLLKNFNFEII